MQACVVVLCLIASQLPEPERAIVLKLTDEDTWSNPKKRKVLHDSLRAAEPLGIKRLAPTLTRHIDYEANGKASTRESRYPAYAVVRGIGISAVPDLLGQIKTLAAEDRGALAKRQLLVECILEIYEKGGFGKELGIKRLELELAACSEKEKKPMQEALKLAAKK
jgi:hypothetical protein